jgi:hypothetical protein
MKLVQYFLKRIPIIIGTLLTHYVYHPNYYLVWIP